MYADSYMVNKPDYELIGTYFGLHNAEYISNLYSATHDTMITHSGTKFDKFDFYSVWGKKVSTIEKLIRDGIFDD